MFTKLSLRPEQQKISVVETVSLNNFRVMKQGGTAISACLCTGMLVFLSFTFSSSVKEKVL
jgi:hypothetical protein